MRASLLHPKSNDRRHLRRRRDRHRSAIGATDAVVTAAVAADALRERTETRQVAVTADTKARQVRAAGGPLDRAFYSCGCGYVFVAAVSTTVDCPHCGDAQAW